MVEVTDADGGEGRDIVLIAMLFIGIVTAATLLYMNAPRKRRPREAPDVGERGRW